MEYHSISKTLDSCYTLFLDEIGEPEENVLRLMLVEGKRNTDSESRVVAGKQFDDLHLIEATSDSRTFELIWHRYTAYCVTNELFGKPEMHEMPDSGRLLRRYSSSSFLDFVAASTIATEAYPGPQIHVRVLSENHVVDVISTEMPSLRSL